MEKNMVIRDNKHYSTILAAAALLLFMAVNLSSLGFANFNTFERSSIVTEPVNVVQTDMDQVGRPKMSMRHGVKPFNKMSEKKLKQLSASLFLVLADKRNY